MTQHNTADRMTEAQFADIVRELIIDHFARKIEGDMNATHLAKYRGEEMTSLFLFFNAFYSHLSEWEGEECRDEDHRFFRILSPEAFAVVNALFNSLSRNEFSDHSPSLWSL